MTRPTTTLSASGPAVLTAVGVKPVINACGIYTDLGGSRLSPRVWAAMEQVNRCFVRMPELLDKTGERIATLLGTEAARITPGAAAAIMLGTAACMAGADGTKSERLPDTAGMKGEVLIQRRHRYKYDRQVGMTGARLIEVGTDNGTNTDQLEQAISPQTAMIIHPAHLDGHAGTIRLEEVSGIARRHGVPVLVDAAYMNYPTSLMGGFVKRGGDLVAISAKYFGGPNAGGFLTGRRDLVAAISNVHFTRYESGKYLKYGRPLKMDRQTIVAVMVALEEWLETDHAARFAGYARLVELLGARLQGIRGLEFRPMCFTMDEKFVPEPVNCLVIEVDARSAGKSAGQLAAELAAGDPGILAIEEDGAIGIVMDVLLESEVLCIAERVRQALAR